MAGKQKNMFGGFGAAAQQRKEQQEKIEAAVTGVPVSAAGREKRRGEDATTITLTISKEDKALIKSWAALHGTSMSEMLHGWITQTCKGGEG